MDRIRPPHLQSRIIAFRPIRIQPQSRQVQPQIQRRGGGKSRDYRTTHVFGGAHLPIFLATVFARNEKDNLGMAGRVALVAMGQALPERYGDRR